MLKFNPISALLQGLFLCFGTAEFGIAGQLPTTNYAPQIASPSNEGELAIKQLRIPPGFQVELVAAEPLLANPVAFTIDAQGRYYVCETFRLHDGVTDIRGKETWLDEDLAARTVDDRLALMKRHLGSRISQYGIHPDRVRRLEDRDGDGKADHATVFADGFNHPLDGIGAGVIARGRDVWFANLPNLWLLRDNDADGVADERKSLHYGFGVRIGFLGHDLHGLCFGPDGKLYFTIGDRGSHIDLGNGKSVGDPDSGCVFRCNPDGSDLEVFAFGLRNPQELAFDQYGNLFTGDNNSDGGDRARFVHLVEGGDSGWRIGYQFIHEPTPRGPWNAEKLWHPAWNGQAAYLLPPITNIADGPSGFAYYPGTGLPSTFDQHFFLCDFHGGRSSGIHSFTLKPSGASFDLVNPQKFLWDGLPTDVEFGVDGGVYYSDWVHGWGKTGKGRIYRVFDPEAASEPIVKETKQLLAGGMEDRSRAQLSGLLAHRDMRVRQAAQFELAARHSQGIKPLVEVATKSKAQLARLHAIWGLGQILSDRRAAIDAKHRSIATEPFGKLLNDSDPEVRAQAAKVAGDCQIDAGYGALLKRLQDPEPRVRFFAAMSIGKFGRTDAVQPTLEMLRENADRDRYLRHAGVMALSRIADMDTLLAAASDPAPSVRMAVLLALRRLERAEIARFLNDPEPALVVEAARAINDQPIYGALTELAGLIDQSNLPEPLLRRVINANFRLGTESSAAALAAFASRSEEPQKIRAEALDCLAHWEHPSGRDRVTGCWKPMVGGRSSDTARRAIEPRLSNLLRDDAADVQVAAVTVVERLGMDSADSILFELVESRSGSARVRTAALGGLAALKSSQLPEGIRLAASDPSETVRKQAARLVAKLDPSIAVDLLAMVLESGTISERQNALSTLAATDHPRADHILEQWIDRLLTGNVPEALKLDVVDAAEKRNAPGFSAKLEAYNRKLKESHPLGAFRVAIHGGNAENGRKIFVERAEAACFRCHKVDGEGGEVGPDLTGIGAKQSREYLLESILYPNKAIAAGFESATVVLKDGVAYAGVVKNETDSDLILNSPEDGLITIKKSEIARRDPGISAMPEGVESILSRQDLRDLVEFLATRSIGGH